MSLVLDTGPILAMLDRDDPDHTRCVALIDSTREDLVIPAPVLVEVDYWCRKLLGTQVWKTFVDDIGLGAYRLFNLDPRAALRAAEIETEYDDLRIGYVDAAVITTCELLNERKVATLDARHFNVVRPTHCERLELLPA